MDDCIFCKIAKGEIPTQKVYEDKLFIAFADTNPVVEGHTLVIPKKHFDNIFDVDNEIAGKMNIVCKKIANILCLILFASIIIHMATTNITIIKSVTPTTIKKKR